MKSTEITTDSIQSTCCQVNGELQAVPSNFQRMLILDWYDGPTSGVLICERCQLPFRFFMVDWDEQHDKRVFALAALPDDALQRLIDVLEETPKWPMWFPAKLVAANKEFDSSSGLLNGILSRAETLEIILVWSNRVNKPVAVHHLEPSLRSRAVDWFSVDGPEELFDWLSYIGNAS